MTAKNKTKHVRAKTDNVLCKVFIGGSGDVEVYAHNLDDAMKAAESLAVRMHKRIVTDRQFR